MRHARLLRQQYSLSLDTGVIMGPRNGVSEVVIPPRSPLIGTTVYCGMAAPDGDLVKLGGRKKAKKKPSPNGDGLF